MPSGRLLVLPDWVGAKDHLVGLELDEETGSLLKWVSVAGFAFAFSGGAILATHRQCRVLR